MVPNFCPSVVPPPLPFVLRCEVSEGGDSAACTAQVSVYKRDPVLGEPSSLCTGVCHSDAPRLECEAAFMGCVVGPVRARGRNAWEQCHHVTFVPRTTDLIGPMRPQAGHLTSQIHLSEANDVDLMGQFT